MSFPLGTTDERESERGQMTTYEEFLRAKAPKVEAAGFDATLPISDCLFPFQRDTVRWALKRGRAALFEECGLGKTIQELEWARHVAHHTGGRVLILAPLAVAGQTVREGEKFGLSVKYAREQSEVTGPVTVTNYERLAKFDAKAFAGVVLDECFAAGTLVDTPSGAVPIEAIREGDRILNASGVDIVSGVHRREVKYAAKVSLATGARFIASPNHPVFTQRGWVGSQHLRPGDYALDTRAAVRLVREAVHADVCGAKGSAVLRDVLLSEMANETAGGNCEGAFARSGDTTRPLEGGLVRSWEPCRAEGTVADYSVEPHGRSGGAREDLPPIERDRPRTFRAWGKWSRHDRAAATLAGCSWLTMASGICLVTGPTDGELPESLQDRLGALREEAGHRSGWVLPCGTRATRARCEEGREAAFIRVDGLEILEPGHPDLERLRSPDGALYFHDLGGTRHPSFSVGNILVHNSSILKSFMGATKRALVDSFQDTPFRLACTATPAPNDHMELGNHSEFLGILSGNEMLTRWFINDTSCFGTYRLKGHAREDYWDWVTSWAKCIGKPSDCGVFDDAGYNLPALVQHRHVVDVDIRAGAASDKLFRLPDLSATSIHAERRRTANARAKRIAELVVAEPDEPWILWCDTDYESDALQAAIASAVDVRGSESLEAKERKLAGFATGEIKHLISKPKLAGFGLNWQHCARVAFISATFSFEQYYQAVRRVWRFGQLRPVDVHIAMASTETDVFAVLQRKAEAHHEMASEMWAAMRRSQLNDRKRVEVYGPTRPARVPQWLCSQP